MKKRGKRKEKGIQEVRTPLLFFLATKVGVKKSRESRKEGSSTKALTCSFGAFTFCHEKLGKTRDVFSSRGLNLIETA